MAGMNPRHAAALPDEHPCRGPGEVGEMKRIVVLDHNGFLGVPPGTPIKFIMDAEMLKTVDRLAEAVTMDRGKLLMATIVDESIDLDAPVFIQPRIIQRDQVRDDPRHPITVGIIADGLPKALTLSATQKRTGMPQGKLLTLIVTTDDTPAA